MADDLELSRVVLGFWRLLDWNLTTNELIKYLEECLDIGITTMDHADIYGNYTVEEKFGEAIKKRPDLRNRCRSLQNAELFINLKQPELNIMIIAKNILRDRLKNR